MFIVKKNGDEKVVVDYCPKCERDTMIKLHDWHSFQYCLACGVVFTHPSWGYNWQGKEGKNEG